MQPKYRCVTCGVGLSRGVAHLRGNAIDDEPTAWCRVHAIAAGIFTPPVPPARVVAVPRPRVETAALRRRLHTGQR